ncbi:hypothetical protein SAMN05216357_11822 [Porphyromonadaceae bacterium KH3CP3RA]|nr:hypothetical protein SAMN05216357_11822 [Porphyromonadaceae bacterium KH3CP3RA]
MESILKYKSNRTLNIGIVIIGIFILGVLIQGCNSEGMPMASDEKIDNLAQSHDFQNYISTLDTYKKKTSEAIGSLSIEEQEQLFNNLNNDDYMMSFMKEYDLIEDNIALQKTIFSLKQNQDWTSLNDTEKNTLLIKNINQNITTFPRLKSGEEIGTSECERIFNDEMTKLNALTSLKLVGCTCMIEVPIAACICYITVMAEHYLAVEKLVKEKEQCERNR